MRTVLLNGYSIFTIQLCSIIRYTFPSQPNCVLIYSILKSLILNQRQIILLVVDLCWRNLACEAPINSKQNTTSQPLSFSTCTFSLCECFVCVWMWWPSGAGRSYLPAVVDTNCPSIVQVYYMGFRIGSESHFVMRQEGMCERSLKMCLCPAVCRMLCLMIYRDK